MRICGQQLSPCIAISLSVCEMGKEQPVPPSSLLSPSKSPAPFLKARSCPSTVEERKFRLSLEEVQGRDQRQACATLKLGG